MEKQVTDLARNDSYQYDTILTSHKQCFVINIMMYISDLDSEVKSFVLFFSVIWSVCDFPGDTAELNCRKNYPLNIHVKAQSKILPLSVCFVIGH